MKIGVIGAGNVGGALGKIWAAKGHEVVFGVRNPSDPKLTKLVKSAGSRARAASVKEAAEFGEVVAFATPWPATQEAVAAAGDLRGKILVDCVNPLKPDLSGLEIGHTTSAAEEIAKWAPGAKVVKAFNTIGAGSYDKPRFGKDSASMFICGDDAGAKSVVGKLAGDMGFEVVDAGALTAARLLEPLAMLWIHLAFKQGLGPNHAFRLLKR